MDAKKEQAVAVKNEKYVEFVKDAVYNGEIVHRAGQKKNMDNSLGMADRWIKRGVAIEIKEEKKAAAQTPGGVAGGKNPADNKGKDDL